ncbi:Osmosensitive K channel His kinase sensor [Planctopirus limnophila DSM 3776]|uniref:histidine kinase n=1 Tax=Planctopirus limnophila (strain ATCC 43296 / DSM 3776 / IFAM 1008 / Mu 290) TaxID=521674 RepID=D5SYH6_PLAL2|nr:sensor histidine kinase KdpD [Planctopirus limnophila]ADG67704.1 Osmosensitive K channel His kinase sensor [Planctopirus limnophila DSM 3776]
MPDARPNPDDLLAKVQAEDTESTRGSLKVFFGYAAGVGKTYTMLENAQRAKAAGREVVVGYVEPHGRPETEALLAGLEVLPLREFEYRGVRLRDFDVDAALARNPDLLLVDELAHTNAVGCRHEKRWQDVEELLEAGINVWTTLNVQHIESLNDVIGQITGVTVRETVPDRAFDLADDLELVDITPEELLHRLKAGKVYVPDQAQRAIQSFFQKSNLTALRELSLRQAARRIHTDVESARREKAAIQPWATAERLLVCVGPSPTTARVIRTARRMAAALDAPWLAVSVDLTGEPASSPRKQQVSQHFRLAERLGAETVTLAGQNVSETILDYARSRNVTKILIGKTNQPRWRRLLAGTVVDDLLEKSGDIDVYVIRGEEEKTAHAPARTASTTQKLPYFWAVGLVSLTGLLAYGLRFLHLADAEANTVMLFLAAVAWTAFRYGRGPAVFASVLAVLVFDFFFVAPFHTFAVADTQYVVTFAVMLTIGLVISTLTSRLRAQIENTRLRERRTSSLYELGKQLSSLYGNVFLVGAAGGKVAEMVGGEVAIYLRQPSGPPELAFGHDTTIVKHSVSLPVAQWVIEHDQLAGAGTNTLPNAAALFFPLTGSQGTHGAIAIRVPDTERLLDPEFRRLLDACANQLALALERDQLAIEAANARIQAEAEQVRSSLLSSVSHDLKTPLAAIAGASSSLLEATSLDEETRRQLLETVADEAARLNRLLENILQMSKLDAGAAVPLCQWHVLEELVGSALHRTRRELAQHDVAVQLSSELPLLYVDGLLMEQVFVNLFENAARYTPEGTKVTIRAALDGDHVRIGISDNGPGLPAGAEERIFDKFYRASPTADGGRGSGLGLAICRAIIKAHGGTLVAANRPGGGAEFVIRLPVSKDAPQVMVE